MSRKSSRILLVVVVVAFCFYVGMEKMDDFFSKQYGLVNTQSESKSEILGIEEGSSEEAQSPDAPVSVKRVGIGFDAPDFTLKDVEGNDISLSDYRGKIVLMNFWATWCVYCDLEMPDIQQIQDENEDVIVLAVNAGETSEVIEKYMEEHGYNFKVLLDPDLKISKEYLVSGYPMSYFVNKDGLLVQVIPGMTDYNNINKVLDRIR